LLPGLLLMNAAIIKATASYASLSQVGRAVIRAMAAAEDSHMWGSNKFGFAA
jgi:hypothetical protein